MSMGRAMAAYSWALTGHCCRKCFGRVLRRPVPTGAVYRCADCGFEAEGADDGGGPAVICGCGALPPGFRTKLACIPNPNRSDDEFPSEIVLAEVTP
jgi:hypothetical protein